MRPNFHTFEGSLWTDSGEVLREVYARTFRNIETGVQLRATLRAGEFAWPGGYQMAFFTSDGALLCFDCVRENLESVTWSIRHDCADGWQVVGADIVADYDGAYCDHCARELSE